MRNEVLKKGISVSKDAAPMQAGKAINNFNKEMEDIMKIVKSLEESELLIKGISETIKSEAKEQKGGFLPMLLGTLTASMLGSALT